MWRERRERRVRRRVQRYPSEVCMGCSILLLRLVGIGRWILLLLLLRKQCEDNGTAHFEIGAFFLSNIETPCELRKDKRSFIRIFTREVRPGQFPTMWWLFIFGNPYSSTGLNAGDGTG